MVWKGLACSAAMAVLACSSVALADSASGPYLFDDTTAPSSAPSTAPATAPSGPTSLTPLMFVLDPTPVGKWLENNKFDITGFTELGYFIDTNNPRSGTGPHDDSPTFISFPGAYSNHLLLDQLDLTIDKTIDSTKSWDWGFFVETGYGTDDAYIHSNGILSNRTPSFAPGVGSPQNQLDLVQANASLLVPLGSGLTIQAGKFVALFGNETINPTTNLFYSHSYNFFYGIMFNNTRLTGSYTFSKLIMGNDLTVIGGISNGWNQSIRDNNGAIDALGEASFNLTKSLAMVMNFEEGPESAGDNGDYWTTVEAIPTYTVSDQLTVAGDFLYSDAPHVAVTTPGESAQWYGAAFYSNYKLDSMFALNARAEWYRDQGGATTGTQANYYELTLGVQIHPLPNDNIFQYLQFRPEIRLDDSDRRVYNMSHDNGAGDYSEVTFAVDAIMQF